MPPLYEMIAEMALFANFTDKEKKEFAALDHAVLGFNDGDLIIKEGDCHTSLYLLLKGSLLVTKQGYAPALSELKPGAIFGEMSFFTKKPRHSNVIACGKVMVIRMDDNFFTEVSPTIKDKIKTYLIELLITRLDSMNESLIKISRYARGSAIP